MSEEEAKTSAAASAAASASGAAEQTQPSGEAAQTRGNGKKILVVEDDKFLRELFLKKLYSDGFDVKHAIDATETFTALTEEKPDIILLDLILPGEDGFSILEKLKKDDDLASIPVVVLSNLGQQEDINKAMSLGAVDFLVKANYTLGEIIERVIQTLKEHT